MVYSLEFKNIYSILYMTREFEVTIKLQNENYKVYNSSTKEITETEKLNKNIKDNFKIL